MSRATKQPADAKQAALKPVDEVAQAATRLTAAEAAVATLETRLEKLRAELAKAESGKVAADEELLDLVM